MFLSILLLVLTGLFKVGPIFICFIQYFAAKTRNWVLSSSLTSTTELTAFGPHNLTSFLESQA